MKYKIDKIKSKKNKTPIVCLTAYSKSIAKILDKYCDIVLVGDSLGNALYGMKNTHSVTKEMMINHAISVKKGLSKALCVVDMPKNTYNSPKIAKKNAQQIIRKSKCEAVKIESNKKNYNIIKHLVSSKINVAGHIGFTPQYTSKFKVKGKSSLEEKKLIKEAIKIEEAGAFCIILECISAETSKKITGLLKIPTIGIGSSKNCDGQILVTDDIIGLSGFYPKFIRKYLDISKIIDKGIKKYSKDVLKKKFPKNTNSF
jgi:3-methyl-2-oxobutanoate hydroxymethyltransferase